MKKLLKTIITAKKQTILIHDPIEALIARLCDPSDPIYDKNVAELQQEQNDTAESR